MKNIRKGIDFLTKSSHCNYKLLAVRLASSSSKPNAEVEYIREKKDHVSDEMVKPYAESEKCVKTSYHTRGVYTKRSVAKWLNDKDSGEDWSSEWTAPRTFHASRVPIDIRMGPAQNMVPKPDKYGNLELVKVQNFLHLTPPSVKNHCQQLKKFCTAWPNELATDADCEREFPLDIHTTDYVRASQTQADNRARIVTAQVRLCSMVLNRHARDKLIKLCGGRYDPGTDILTLTSDRCPFRHQNRHYIQYLLTVLYFESWKTESWECYEYASDEDRIYEWEKSNSYQAVLSALRQESASSDKDSSKLTETKELQNYRDAVSKMKLSYKDSTRDEREKTMLQYKESVRNLMNLPHL